MDRAVTIRPVGVDDRKQAAALAYLSFREFYDLLPVSQERLHDLIGAQLGQSGTELDGAQLAWSSDAIAGMYAAIPAVKVRSAQMLSVAKLASSLAPAERAGFMRSIGEFRQRVPAIDSAEGLYLTRIAVAETFQRRGIGRVLLEHFLQQAMGHGRAWLHVHHANAGALAFYRASGFRSVIDVENGYRLLERTAQPADRWPS